jgi:hypothetical protein
MARLQMQHGANDGGSGGVGVREREREREMGCWGSKWNRRGGVMRGRRFGEEKQEMGAWGRLVGSCGRRAGVGRGQRRGAGPFLFYSFDYFFITTRRLIFSDPY